jgi:hypothetical protein
VVPIIRRLLGEKVARPDKSCLARLTINVPSQAGREDWIAVKLIPSTDQSRDSSIFAIPASIISLPARQKPTTTTTFRPERRATRSISKDYCEMAILSGRIWPKVT